MYNVSTAVLTKEIVPNEKIVFEWGESPKRTVEFLVKPLSDGSTYAVAREYGYQETGDDLIAAIKDSTGGFTTVLDGLKCWLEHGINLNLIHDKFPKEVARHGG